MNMSSDKKTSYNLSELSEFKFDLDHNEVVKNLKNDSEDFVKIFSIIELKNLYEITEAELLFYHLTNQPTPIREAVALKLEEIYSDVFLNDFIKEQFLKSIIDINPNVCRAICNIVSRSQKLQTVIIADLIQNINSLLCEINEQDKQLGNFFDNAKKIRKNHAKNKKLFSLYWYLEVLSICKFEKYNSEVLEIIKQTIKFNDYTIREKTAKILMNIKDAPDPLLQMIQNDENFYVKNLIYGKINFDD